MCVINGEINNAFFPPVFAPFTGSKKPVRKTSVKDIVERVERQD